MPAQGVHIKVDPNEQNPTSAKMDYKGALMDGSIQQHFKGNFKLVCDKNVVAFGR